MRKILAALLALAMVLALIPAVMAEGEALEPITLTVDSRGKVNGFGGVNYYNGQLRDTFANGSFQFDGAVAATMRYGRGINQERDFFQKLNQIDSWQVNADGVLELRAKGKVILKFARKQDPNSR